MFKSLREFSLDKPVSRAKLKIRHTREGHEGIACTIVQLYNTEVVKRVNINNITTLNSGGWKTPSTKTCINTALRLIYGNTAPQVFQSKHVWHVEFSNGRTVPYFDGMILGGGHGVPYTVLN